MMKQAYEAGKAAGKAEAEAALAEVVAVTKAKQLTDLELVTAYNSRRFRNQQRTGIKLAPVPPLGVQKPTEPRRADTRSAPTATGGGSSNSVSVEGAKPEEKPAPPWEQARQAMALAKVQDGARPVIDMDDPLTQKAARDFANRVMNIKYGAGVQS
jgi:hypothetical protein